MARSPLVRLQINIQDVQVLDYLGPLLLGPLPLLTDSAAVVGADSQRGGQGRAGRCG